MLPVLQEPPGFWKLGLGRNSYSLLRNVPPEAPGGAAGRTQAVRLDLAGSSSGVIPFRCPGRCVWLRLLLGGCLRHTGPAGSSRAEPSGSGSTRPGHERCRMMRRRPRRCSRRPRGAAALGYPTRASGECSARGACDPRPLPQRRSPLRCLLPSLSISPNRAPFTPAAFCLTLGATHRSGFKCFL